MIPELCIFHIATHLWSFLFSLSSPFFIVLHMQTCTIVSPLQNVAVNSDVFKHPQVKTSLNLYSKTSEIRFFSSFVLNCDTNTTQHHYTLCCHGDTHLSLPFPPLVPIATEQYCRGCHIRFVLFCCCLFRWQYCDFNVYPQKHKKRNDYWSTQLFIQQAIELLLWIILLTCSDPIGSSACQYWR